MAIPYAASAQNQSVINTLGGDVAINGYDPVAYFVDSKPLKGLRSISTEHGGARWLFATEENRLRFLSSPEAYLPAYGGYCAYGVSQGYLVKIDPEAWAIIDRKLHLNFSLDVREKWRKDVAGYNRKADAQWPKLK